MLLLKLFAVSFKILCSNQFSTCFQPHQGHKYNSFAFNFYFETILSSCRDLNNVQSRSLADLEQSRLSIRELETKCADLSIQLHRAQNAERDSAHQLEQLRETNIKLELQVV